MKLSKNSNTQYDPEADALYIRVGKRQKSARTQKLSSGMFVDYDSEGKIVGIEILRASEKVQKKTKK